MQVLRFALIALLFFGLGVSACLPLAFPPFLTPTPPPLPSPTALPTRVAVAMPTPTLNLIPPGDDSDATLMLQAFIAALNQGDLNTALTYWNTRQSQEYAANVRQMVQEWITRKRRLTVQGITYLGRDATGKFIPVPLTDPRVEHAIAKVLVDGIEYQFYLTQLKGGWFIEGVNTFAK